MKFSRQVDSSHVDFAPKLLTLVDQKLPNAVIGDALKLEARRTERGCVVVAKLMIDRRDQNVTSLYADGKFSFGLSGVGYNIKRINFYNLKTKVKTLRKY